jgi:hypothetical protein
MPTRSNPDYISGGLGAGSATRDVKNLRNKDSITERIKKGNAEIADLSANHHITVDWELNDQAVKDKIFKLTIDDKEVYIDYEEWLFVQRVMFMKG